MIPRGVTIRRATWSLCTHLDAVLEQVVVEGGVRHRLENLDGLDVELHLRGKLRNLELTRVRRACLLLTLVQLRCLSTSPPSTLRRTMQLTTLPMPMSLQDSFKKNKKVGRGPEPNLGTFRY